MAAHYTYDRNGNRTGYVDDSGRRFDNCGNYKGHTDRSTAYSYNRSGDRTSWYDKNTGYSYDRSGNRTSWYDKNTGRSYDSAGNYRGHKSKY